MFRVFRGFKGFRVLGFSFQGFREGWLWLCVIRFLQHMVFRGFQNARARICRVLRAFMCVVVLVLTPCHCGGGGVGRGGVFIIFRIRLLTVYLEAAYFPSFELFINFKPLHSRPQTPQP